MVDRWSRIVAICVPLFFFLFGRTLEQQLLASWDERLALLQLRSSLGLRAKEWPIKADPCTEWMGVHCSTDGRITGINISGFRRTRKGTQNPQFSVDALRNLTLLTSFNASNFQLLGSIPQWFGLQLASLRVLDLRSCSIDGVIPSTLGNSSSLVELYLSGNNLTGEVPSSLGQILGLSVLDLSQNRLTGSIPSTFASLGNLTKLDMSLNLFGGSIPSGIGSLSRLRFLNLSGNSFSSMPDQLGDLSNLVELDIGFNALSGSVPPGFRGLRSLQRMVLGNNLLSGRLPADLFTPLTQLQFVILRHNDFRGDFPRALWLIPSLRLLDASFNNFTGELPNVTSIASSTAAVAVANISHNLLYGELTPVIGRFGVIDLSGNYFQGPVPGYARGDVTVRGNCLQHATGQRSVTDCASFYADRNMVFDNFGRNNGTQPSPRSNKKSTRIIIILASVLGALVLIVLLVLIIVVLIACKRRRRGTTANQVTGGVEPTPAAATPRNTAVPLNLSALGDAFTYQQILQATSEFSDPNLIKIGHSGHLYYGKLEGGIPVVIKKIDLNSAARKESYMSELDLYGKISNPRLVPLLGHCLENENEKFLVYKHMPNGDLSSSLFKKSNSDNDSLQSLDWITRLKIATGAAEVLSYLHHECTPPLVHRDVQASSILLDDKYEVRLGSLSEVCPQESETHQSRISRLLRLPQSSDQAASGTPTATCAYDVYCFGKVLLELVTGKLGISSSPDGAMKEWLDATLPNISIYDKDLVTNIIDPSLIIDEDLLEEVWAMAIVARSCLNPRPGRRPLMRYILKALENPLKVVREEQPSSARLRTTSSRGSWNAALFGSWRHSSSDVAGTSHKVEGGGSFKQIGVTTGSQGSGGGHNGDGHGNGNSNNGNSSSARRHSKEIFPEPVEDEDIEGGRGRGRAN
ncbi:probable LRR receptor-like serine/threonine-protein kinase At2g16250 [Andrographis paniculata]|uniref:probable LRR receptor-like serine/threonine-protein kinase At2g16250 n=1 Tax=Andrographis paniculata TaxID=175694 RepID=UPI0021E9744E|nr:probable LRR receptor-like serine/threonine-protein kinase At2g16250 [Andrographis paniculata]